MLKMNRRTSRTGWLLLLSGVLALGLAACGQPGGLTAEEAEDLRMQVSDVETRVGNLEAAITEMEVADAEARDELASEVRDELSLMRTTLQDIEAALEPPPEPDPIDEPDPLAPDL